MKPIGAADLPSPLTLTGGQIAFPATQSPSANVNTLDDYEEGTWTPYWAVSGGQSGQTYLAQDGSYTKIGNRVFATGRIVLAVLGTITGNALVAGLPFQASGSFYAVGTLTVTFVANLGAAVSLISGQVGQGGYYADMYYVPAAGGTSFTAVTATQMTSNLDLYFHVSYQASA
jgi:hypothetical protein